MESLPLAFQNSLPIDEVLASIRTALDANKPIILSAEPGAGKTTRVPLALLDASWLQGRSILLLEPRRIAAVGAARFMAKELGEEVGGRVGYRIRGDVRVGKRTSIEVLTEGLLTRMFLRDSAIEEVGAIIFDEFHERSIHSDFGLALALQVRELIRPELRIVIMSATIDTDVLGAVLVGAETIVCPGRVFPVQVTHVPEEYPSGILRAIRLGLQETSGHILVFLPGMREISHVERLLGAEKHFRDCLVCPLSSQTSVDAQRTALERSERRKIILATSVAETSITISGVTAVVDSGLSRMPRFDLGRGMDILETIPVSQASADQRKGRAGRDQPGKCYRVWPENTHLQPYHPPEILREDLTPLALDLASWGATSSSELAFIDPPNSKMLSSAQQLLHQLGAISSDGAITPLGKQMSNLGVHPRYSRMIFDAKARGGGELACKVAAILEEPDFLSREKHDIRLSARIEEMKQGSGKIQRIQQQSERLQKMAEITKGDSESLSIGALVALAYPDRIGKRREHQSAKYLLSGGVGAELPPGSMLRKSEFIAVAHIDGSGVSARIHLAEEITERELRSLFADSIVTSTDATLDENSGRVMAKSVERLGAIVLKEVPISIDDGNAGECLLAFLREHGIPWDEESRHLCVRAAWVRSVRQVPENWPDLRDEALLHSLDMWLAPFLPGVRSVQEVPIVAALENLFSRECLAFLESSAPKDFALPTGTRARIFYSADQPPRMPVLLQELFGQKASPTVSGVPIVLELLSPARRPLQVTADLASFWKTSYKTVRGEMQRRYPRHVWPEDPENAPPVKKGLKR